MTREEEILNGVAGILAEELNPQKILLFGSRAKGRNSKNADFDFAVDADEPDFEKQRKIEDRIEDVAGLYSVDVVYLGNVENDFRKIILKTGKIVYER